MLLPDEASLFMLTCTIVWDAPIDIVLTIETYAGFFVASTRSMFSTEGILYVQYIPGPNDDECVKVKMEMNLVKSATFPCYKGQTQTV